jgi:hypothetical protein
MTAEDVACIQFQLELQQQLLNYGAAVAEALVHVVARRLRCKVLLATILLEKLV